MERQWREERRSAGSWERGAVGDFSPDWGLVVWLGPAFGFCCGKAVSDGRLQIRITRKRKMGFAGRDNLCTDAPPERTEEDTAKVGVWQRSRQEGG
jgi:hypothetical protein